MPQGAQPAKALPRSPGRGWGHARCRWNLAYIRACWYVETSMKINDLGERGDKTNIRIHSDMGFPGGSDGKASACNAGGLGSIPG